MNGPEQFTVGDIQESLAFTVNQAGETAEALVRRIRKARADGEHAEAAVLEVEFRQRLRHGMALQLLLESLLVQGGDRTAIFASMGDPTETGGTS